jgi:pyruvate ferredoxin oxidoreductase alpha subunit
MELMHEILFIASGMRLPIVMAAVNRALSSPLSIWGDHSDIMAARDTGWVMVFCENGQEVVDSIIMAFKIAEDRRVLLPMMVNLDGFSLSHVIEPIEFPLQEDVDRFLPPYNPLYTLHPDKPVTMGAYAMPELYTEAKYSQEMAIRNSKDVVKEVMDQFSREFGRTYNLVETYNTEKADTVFMALGSINENIKTAIDSLKEAGKELGLVSLRLFRPFPDAEVLEVLKTKKKIVVLERVMPGGAMNGPLFNEMASLVVSNGLSVQLENFIFGLGGRDVEPEELMEVYEQVVSSGKLSHADNKNYGVIGVRS